MGMLPKRTLLLTPNSSIFEIPKFANENCAESRKKNAFIIFFRIFFNTKVFDQSAHRKTLLLEPNAYDKWRGPGCVQIPLLTEPNAYDKWRAHGHRVRRAFFQKKKLVVLFVFVFFCLIHKVFDQSAQWKSV